jgi:hypothetical protein
LRPGEKSISWTQAICEALLELLEMGLTYPALNTVFLPLEHLYFHQQRQAFIKGQFIVLQRSKLCCTA